MGCRVTVVDEAFMDAVPGEPESLAAASIPGLVVIRSLTKTWGLAGLRVGYVLAGASLIEQLAAVQPHWPVSTPALAAAIACCERRLRPEDGGALRDRQQTGMVRRGGVVVAVRYLEPLHFAVLVLDVEPDQRRRAGVGE